MPNPALLAFFRDHQRVFVLTGAGCSTGSGIPAYRGESGEWMRRQPVTWQAFRVDPSARRRYWARSMVGWPAFGAAQPNRAHHALAALERTGRLTGLVTQNVDGLHQAAGQRHVVDLHGRLDTVLCLTCGARSLRRRMQQRLLAANPDWAGRIASIAPDGDADLEDDDFSRFEVPNCERCHGTLKPDVVLFGENVPRERLDQTMAWLDQSDALLVVGSSLMVFSGLRYVRRAAERGIPIVAINRGKTRADDLFAHKIETCCAQALDDALRLAPSTPHERSSEAPTTTIGLV